MKVTVLRQHFVDETPISRGRDRQDLQPSVFHAWRPTLVEGQGNGPAAAN